MTSPSDLISSTRVEEGFHDRVTVWNRGGNAGTLTVRKGDGVEVAARLLDGCELEQRTEEERAALCDRIVELAKELDATNACFDLERSHRKQVEREKDAACARVAELEALLRELLATDGGEGSECWDATRFLAARNKARALLAKERG